MISLFNLFFSLIFVHSPLFKSKYTNYSCLLTPFNVFANIQVNGKPSDLARVNGFNLHDVKKWRTIFPYQNPFLDTNKRQGRRSLSIQRRLSLPITKPKSSHEVTQDRLISTSKIMDLFFEASNYADEVGQVVLKWGSLQTISLDYGLPADADECIDIAQRIQV